MHVQMVGVIIRWLASAFGQNPSVFQMGEMVVPQRLFQAILEWVSRLWMREAVGR